MVRLVRQDAKEESTSSSYACGLLSGARVAVIACTFLLQVFQVLVQAAEPETIEIYEPDGTHSLDAPSQDMQPIVLQVPGKFRYGSSKGNSRNWGLNVLTYYPSFTSPEDPENAKFSLSCVGI